VGDIVKKTLFCVGKSRCHSQYLTTNQVGAVMVATKFAVATHIDSPSAHPPGLRRSGHPEFLQERSGGRAGSVYDAIFKTKSCDKSQYSIHVKESYIDLSEYTT